MTVACRKPDPLFHVDFLDLRWTHWGAVAAKWTYEATFVSAEASLGTSGGFIALHRFYHLNRGRKSFPRAGIEVTVQVGLDGSVRILRRGRGRIACKESDP